MAALSLMVCVFRERDLLERLLTESSGLYDDLVVVHDGTDSNNRAVPPPVNAPAKEMALDYGALAPGAPLPAFYKTPSLPARSGSIHELVIQHGGRYFEGPRCFQQEPHWPFSWWQARHDWILRLDADEFPSEEFKAWLRRFRDSPEPTDDISGYTCIWPLWNGTRAVTTRWPTDRIFLFHRRRVKFFGMVELVPIPDTCYQPIELILNHQPKRKSYGVLNILFREQAYNWRRVIAKSLMGKPTDLACWRWTSDHWPGPWDRIRRCPVSYSIKSLIRLPFRQFRDMLKADELPRASACLNPGLHHFMLGLRVVLEKRQSKKQ